MAQRKLSPSDWLTLITERAPGLRAAGISSLTLDGFSVQLTAHVASGKVEVAPMPQESSNPLFDEATYAGGQIPGFDLTDINRDHEEDS